MSEKIGLYKVRNKENHHHHDHHDHNHQEVPTALIILTLTQHPSLSVIVLCKSSRRHPVLAQS